MVDGVADGAVAYAVSVGPTVSSSADYSGLSAADVVVVCLDAQATTPLQRTPLAPSSVTSEDGSALVAYVALNFVPTGSVAVTVTSSNPAEAVVAITGGTGTARRRTLLQSGGSSAVTLAFTTVDFASPQGITIYGVEDDVADGTTTVDFAFTVSPLPPPFTSVSPLTVTVVDNDALGLSLANTPGEALTTSEAGERAFIRVGLLSRPAGASKCFQRGRIFCGGGVGVLQCFVD